MLKKDFWKRVPQLPKYLLNTEFLEEGTFVKSNYSKKEFLEEGVPSFAAACRRRQSCAITPCCPPVVKAGDFITFSTVLAAALTNCR